MTPISIRMLCMLFKLSTQYTSLDTRQDVEAVLSIQLLLPSKQHSAYIHAQKIGGKGHSSGLGPQAGMPTDKLPRNGSDIPYREVLTLLHSSLVTLESVQEPGVLVPQQLQSSFHVPEHDLPAVVLVHAILGPLYPHGRIRS